MTEILPAKTTELRTYVAKTLKIKGHTSSNKATLLAVIAEHEAKLARDAAEANAQRDRTGRATKCPDCGVRRPLPRTESESGLCADCLRKAEWENEHGDFDHEGSNAGDEMTVGCWICHPELDRTAITRKERAGTSREGMAIHVPPRGSGAEKAAAVKTYLHGLDVMIETNKTSVRLSVVTVTGRVVLTWSLDGKISESKVGCFHEVNGKARRILNASAAIRIALEDAPQSR